MKGKLPFSVIVPLRTDPSPRIFGANPLGKILLEFWIGKKVHWYGPFPPEAVTTTVSGKTVPL
jgi:hypothetical protein